MAIKPGAIWLIVGESGSGKTTFCRGIIDVARQRGVKVRGLICPARFERGQKVGIDMMDLGSSEQRCLGWRYDLKPESLFASSSVVVGEWILDGGALEWGNQVFLNAVPCDLLVVDELGPLEFYQGIGWQAAFKALESKAYHLALVTVRLSLRTVANTCCKIAREILLDETSLAQVAQQEIKSILTETI